MTRSQRQRGEIVRKTARRSRPYARARFFRVTSNLAHDSIEKPKHGARLKNEKRFSFRWTEVRVLVYYYPGHFRPCPHKKQNGTINSLQTFRIHS
ncbi:MAG: hypothetical protein [Circular genetic element sp.]|nr:MAG: hypothetical protein [Circular genetic element sp.]